MLFYQNGQQNGENMSLKRKRVPVLNARNSVRNSDERRNYDDGDDGDDDGACYLFANFFGDFYGETNG